MTDEKLSIVVDTEISQELLNCYKSLLLDIFYHDLIISNDKLEIILSKFMNVIESLNDLQKEVLKLRFGLVDGKAIKNKDICVKLKIDLKQIYPLLSNSYIFLKRRKYLFIKEYSPSINTLIHQKKFKSEISLCIVDLPSISPECLAGYEKLAHKLFTQDMIESGTQVLLSKLCLTIDNMNEIKIEILKDYYGLLDGKAISVHEISLALGIDKHLIYAYLSSIHSYLKSHFYSFIKQTKPSLFSLLYHCGVDKRCFRKLKDMSTEDFINLTEKELHQMFPSPIWFKELYEAQKVIKKNFKL